MRTPKIKLSLKRIDRAMAKSQWKAVNSWLRQCARRIGEQMDRTEPLVFNNVIHCPVCDVGNLDNFVIRTYRSAVPNAEPKSSYTCLACGYSSCEKKEWFE